MAQRPDYGISPHNFEIVILSCLSVEDVLLLLVGSKPPKALAKQIAEMVERIAEPLCKTIN